MGKSLGVGPKYLFGENTLRDTSADVERNAFADVEMEQCLGGQVIRMDLQGQQSKFLK